MYARILHGTQLVWAPVSGIALAKTRCHVRLAQPTYCRSPARPELGTQASTCLGTHDNHIHVMRAPQLYIFNLRQIGIGTAQLAHLSSFYASNMSWSVEAAMAALRLASDDELAQALQADPDLLERIEANAPQAQQSASSSSAAPNAQQSAQQSAQQQPFLVPSFGGLAPQFGVLPMAAGPFGGCMVPVPGPPPLPDAPPSAAASLESPSAFIKHQVSFFQGQEMPDGSL